MIEDYLRETIRKFNEKAKSNAKLKEELAGIERRVMVSLDDGRKFHFILTDGAVSDLVVGPIDKPHVVIESSEVTLEALFKKELRPMKAIATKKVRINATMDDMIRFRKFLS